MNHTTLASAASSSSSLYLLHTLLMRRRHSNHHHSQTRRLKSCFFLLLPTTLALTTSLLILLYISSTSNLFSLPPHHPPIAAASSINRQKMLTIGRIPDFFTGGEIVANSDGMHNVDQEVFYDRDVFLESYKEMNRSLKIYVYRHRPDEAFANVLLPVDFEPRGNYASESYFKKVLFSSHFVTTDPSAADFFFLPFSIARLRHDPRVGIHGIQDFIRDYVLNISLEYPFWNRSNGADHFYVACHSIGRTAMEKVVEVKNNAIQIVCSSNYYLSSYIAHKDASLPQIWPRQDDPPNLACERPKLAFFAGSINSPVREKLLQEWQNDTEISVHSGHLLTSYAEELLSSKFCLHVKGFEVNTARIGDALYYGCIPVIIANHYDLPFQDILNWKSFSIIVATLDIPFLKKILKGISDDEYATLQSNVFKVRKHFQWHLSPVDFDAFYLVMYELWIRRGQSYLRVEDEVL